MVDNDGLHEPNESNLGLLQRNTVNHGGSLLSHH